MKKIISLFVSILLVSSLGFSAWKFNPFTGKFDYYEAGIGAKFINLTDTPANYTGASLKFVRVNVGETALEFVTITTADEKVKIDAAATAGYLGAASNDGVLRTDASIGYADGGDFITLSTTKALIGLGNVENTALSTWAGTTNITTLGTIGTCAGFSTTGAVDVNSGGASGEIGVDFNSINNTFSTIAQSDAEGIASSSDLRIGVDESTRTLILCDRGDIAADFGLTASSHPTLIIHSAAVNRSIKINAFSIAGDDADFRIYGSKGVSFKLTGDLATGNAFRFVQGNAVYELTGNNSMQSWAYFEPETAQSGTAAFNGLYLNLLAGSTFGDGSTGDGNNFIRFADDGTTKFKIDTTGIVTFTNAETLKNTTDGTLEYTGFWGEDFYDEGSESGAFTIDWRHGNYQKVTITGVGLDITFVEPDTSGRCFLMIIQGDGDDTLDWEHEISPDWPGDVEPVLSVGAGAVDLIMFFYDDGAKNYLGLANLDFR